MPMVIDYAKTAEQRAALTLVLAEQDIGWPYIMAAEAPPDRVKAVRDAFDAMVRDRDFLADAAKRKLDISPVRGEVQAELVRKLFDTPRAIVQQVEAIVGEP